MSTLTTCLIIVTKDRPDDIQICLEYVSKLTVGFNSIVIVDSSESDQPKEVIDTFTELPITYQHSHPGITKQRNVARGLVPSNTDIVLYIDDDVRLMEHTVSTVQQFFTQHPEAVGMTGKIIGEAPHSLFKEILGAAAYMYTPQPFGYTKGLFNIINTPHGTSEVQWLPGAFMAYRWKQVSEIAFDEWFTTYGLAEDFDFSYRVSQIGKIYAMADLEVHHVHSSVGRNWERFGYMRVVNREYLRKKLFNGKFDYWIGYWVATKSMVLFNLVRSVLGGSNSVRYAAELRGNIRGLKQMLLKKG